MPSRTPLESSLSGNEFPDPSARAKSGFHSDRRRTAVTNPANEQRISGAQSDPRRVGQRLEAIRRDIVSTESTATEDLSRIHQTFLASAQNLLHYLALRRHDLRPLQLDLAALGLSSLGRAEPHVLASIDAVLTILRRATGAPEWSPPGPVLDFAEGRRLLAAHTEALLGPATAGRDVRIMVTMPTEAADDYSLVHDLLHEGMDCARINCAHDGPDVWSRMIGNLRRAEAALGRRCRVVMDLAGPKLRTGPVEPGPAVVRIRPERDRYGRVIAPARVWLARDAGAKPPTEASAILPLPGPWLDGLRIGHRMRFTDARDAKRRLTVVDVTDQGSWAECTKTAYVAEGTVLRHKRSKSGRTAKGRVTGLPTTESSLQVRPDDALIVTRDPRPGRPATYDSTGRLLTPASIGCTIPSVLDDVQPGEAIWFDDGRMGGVIERVEADHMLVRLTHVRPGGDQLRSDKGINLPDTELRLGAVTPKDLEDLAFVSEHADVVELSFANGAGDVELLEERLRRPGARQPGIVLKIETRRGFEHLPEMLLAAMRWPCCGVMIARGDLAIEAGFGRLAEVQEEILWICEAAHVPVIWATQVLETLAKEGVPSRAEVTDAAMGNRAECVMLNKGPHVVAAVRALDDILRRMASHQTKKRAMLRELRLAHALTDPENE
jgi:pyruvate kinase